MKFHLFLVYFSCYVASDIVHTAEDKPLMYYDGAEWKTMKPNRNITSGTRRPNLSAFLDLYLTSSNLTNPNDNETDFIFTTTPQTVIARVFNEDNHQKVMIKTTTVQDMLKEKSYSNKKDNTSNKTDYNKNHLINNTDLKDPRHSSEGSANTTLPSDPADWIKLMLELSMTLKDIAEKQNLSYFTHKHTNNTKNATSIAYTPSNVSIPTTITTLSPVSLGTTGKTHANIPENRRTMEGLDDIIALLTGGIQIDNGSESSDELNKGNKNYMKKVYSPKSQIKENLAGISNRNNFYRDTDSADIVSDGVEETRFVLVEDKSDAEDVRLRHE